MPPDRWQIPWAGGNVRPGPVLADPPERLPCRQPRQIIQLCSAGDGLFALCDDGSVWQLLAGVWLPEPGIPQRQAGGEE